MVKVITYGTYDLLHYGHINLLKRAKALGDYLIVGITSEDFDRARGKLLVSQSLSERIEAVKATGIADEIILEEYDGQKIDDIKKYGADIFAVGSDWRGKFDYLSQYCRVVYLPRTEGISSTDIRNNNHTIGIGVVGYSPSLGKFEDECRYVSGTEITGFFNDEGAGTLADVEPSASYDALLEKTDAVYIVSSPERRYALAKKALSRGKHVLCETPVALDADSAAELYALASEKGVVFCEALKTAYSLAFQRMILLLRGGVIGKVKSLDATCTSLRVRESWSDSFALGGGALVAWGPYVLFAAMKVLGRNPKSISFASFCEGEVDSYSRIQLLFGEAIATLSVGTAVKSEGELIISGTNGYIYVPAPWWKMDYFEVRKEDSSQNKRYFYQFEGEGIRYELAEFIKSIRSGRPGASVGEDYSRAVCDIISKYRSGEGVIHI